MTDCPRPLDDVHLCGLSADLPSFDWPDAGQGMCCNGAAMAGPDRCTCWEPVYDADQADPVDGTGAGIGAAPCVDCAYRPDSPERRGEPHVRGDAALLGSIVETGEPFWCHQGMRRVVAFVHPSGVRYEPPGLEACYRPPIVGDIPRRADGSPADLCAGWIARRLRRLQEAR